MIIQKLESESKDMINRAQRYYTILSALNDLYLTEREVQLIALMAVRGGVLHSTVREEFCTKHDSSLPTINNMVRKLKLSKIFVKQGKHIMVNPVIVLDFSKDILLGITLTINNERETLKHASEGMANQKVSTEAVN